MSDPTSEQLDAFGVELTALKIQLDTQSLHNQEQFVLIRQLETQRNAAKQTARRDSRLARILLLSLPVAIFVFNGNLDVSSEGTKFSLKTKEVPWFVGAGFGVGVLMIVLEREEREAVIRSLKHYLPKS